MKSSSIDARSRLSFIQRVNATLGNEQEVTRRGVGLLHRTLCLDAVSCQFELTLAVCQFKLTA